MAAPNDEGYTVTKDLYLEILWQAQRVEDQKLVALIKQRLTRSAEKLSAAEAYGCGKIIPFPIAAVGPLPVGRLSLPQDEPTLWPRRPALQGLTLFSAYCAMVLFYVIAQHL